MVAAVRDWKIVVAALSLSVCDLIAGSLAIAASWSPGDCQIAAEQTAAGQKLAAAVRYPSCLTVVVVFRVEPRGDVRGEAITRICHPRGRRNHVEEVTMSNRAPHLQAR